MSKHGEPWPEFGDRHNLTLIGQADLNLTAPLSRPEYARARACVNALAEVEEPEAALRGAADLIEHVIRALAVDTRHWKASMPEALQTELRTALARLGRRP